MPFCTKCGFEGDILNFCPNCGYATKQPNQSSTKTSSEKQETAYYKGEGNMIVKTVKKQGTAIKVGIYLLAGPMGYLIFGRDKKKKVTGTGSLIVTDKSIYFAGRDYPYDRIGSITTEGNSVMVEVDVSKNCTNGSGWIDVLSNVAGGLAGETVSIELEITTSDVNNVFHAFEQARFSKVAFAPGVNEIPPPPPDMVTVPKCKFCGAKVGSTNECPKCGRLQRKFPWS
jgi:hypothetical protein